MSRELRKIISAVLCMTMLFSSLGVFAAEENAAEEKAYFFDAEAETLEYNSELVELAQSDEYSGGKALAAKVEDKSTPVADAEPGLSFEFTADRDGDYYVWMRHTSSVSKSNGGNMWMSVNGGKYGFYNLEADPGAPMWMMIKKITLKAGETGKISIIPRQRVNIAYDRFVVSSDAGYEPDDRTLKARASVVAGVKPIPTPTPKPTAIPLTADGKFKIVDTTSEDAIVAVGLTPVTGKGGVNKYSAMWNISKNRDLKFPELNDITNYTNFFIRLRANDGKSAKFIFQLLSQNSETAGDDYYGMTVEVGDEWIELDLPYSKIGATRTPRGLDQIDSFSWRSKGWSIVIEEGTEIYIDELYLYVDENVKKQQEAEVYENENTNLKYKNASAFGDFTKIKDAVCLYIDYPYGLSKTVRTPIDSTNEAVVPFIENSRTLVPVRFISEQLGAEVGYDAETRKVTIKKESNLIEMTIGSNVIYKNGEATEIDVPANIYNDRTFVPLRACAEALDKQVFWDSLGLIIISDTENIYDSDADRYCIASIIGEMIFERPTGSKMIADMNAKNPNNAHPRMFANAAEIADIKERAKTDEQLAKWIDVVIKGGRGAAEQPLVTYIPPEEGKSDTSRMLDVARTAKSKLVSLGIGYQFTGEEKYAEAAWKEIENICNFPEWNPNHFLDTGEFGYGVSFAYDWCYDYFTDEQKAFIEESLYKHIITSAVTAYNGTAGTGHNRSGWKNATTNWNAVCNTGSIMAAICVANNEKYKADCEYLLGEIILSMEKGVRDYAPDGGYAEGPGYWEYGTGYIVRGMCAMETAFGTDYGMSKFPGVLQTGYYATYIDGPTGTFNYSDSGSGHLGISNMMWFAYKAQDADLAGLRYKKLAANSQNASIYDILFSGKVKEVSNVVNLAPDTLFKGIGTAVFRTNWTDASMVYAAIHGGKNNSNHGNLDAGTFVLDANGVRWFSELGADSYSLPGYFGATGLASYYRKRAEGQNTVLINPSLAADQNITAITDVIKYESKPKGGYAILNMADALGVSKVSAAERGMMITGNRRSVVLQDEIDLKEAGEVYWFAHTKADVEISADGRSAILSLNGERLYAKIVSENDAKFTVMEAERLPSSPAKHSLEASNDGIQKLAIHLTDVKNVNLAVVFTALEEGESAPNYSYTYVGMDNWAIEDGEIEIPSVSMITLDGAALENFDPYATEYEIILPYGTASYPKIDATADGDYQVEIKDTEGDGIRTVRVYKQSDNSVSLTYRINIKIQGEVTVEASGNQEGNFPENSYDGDLSTRWSNSGESWIKYTFVEPKEIEAVSIAFMSASARQTIIDLEYSVDGESWIKFFSGMSTMSDNVFEDFKLPQKTAVKAIRITGYGNTTNAWNSINEVEFK